MFSHHPVAIDLPKGTVALTYDDGPGPRTLELAALLRDEDVRATFFVVGKYVRARREVVEAVRGMGHSIGNHTDWHYSWYDLLKQEPKPPSLEKLLVDEVVAADNEIRDFAGHRPFFLRTPGGEWRPWIADLLNNVDELKLRYRGPVNWYIHDGDWQIGSMRASKLYSLEDCQANFFEHIMKNQSGIVLLHDWSADPGQRGEELQSNNRTLELTKWLVPQLKGFNFVTLDEIAI